MGRPSSRERFLQAAVMVAPTLLWAACASSGAVPKPFPTPDSPAAQQPSRAETPRADAGTTPPRAGNAVVATALALRGAPYRNGGTDPKGFDCSGFTQYVFHRFGVALARDVHEQFEQGAPVRPERVRPGDLVFFTTTGPGATHVGIAIGREQFVHAPSSRGVVRVESLSARYWSARYVGARRIGQAALN